MVRKLASRRTIVMLSRSDMGKKRSVTNEGEMLKRIRERFADYELVVFHDGVRVSVPLVGLGAHTKTRTPTSNPACFPSASGVVG